MVQVGKRVYRIIILIVVLIRYQVDPVVIEVDVNLLVLLAVEIRLMVVGMRHLDAQDHVLPIQVLVFGQLGL